MRRAGIIGMVAALSLGVAAAPASALTTKQAKRAVKRELRHEYGVNVVRELHCHRLNHRRQSCRWDGISRKDAAWGNVDGWKGTARVKQYRHGIDVNLHVTQYGY